MGPLVLSPDPSDGDPRDQDRDSPDPLTSLKRQFYPGLPFTLETSATLVRGSNRTTARRARADRVGRREWRWTRGASRTVQGNRGDRVDHDYRSSTQGRGKERCGTEGQCGGRIEDGFRQDRTGGSGDSGSRFRHPHFSPGRVFTSATVTRDNPPR